MNPSDEHQLKEVLELTRENNRMLHAMRRNAFLSGLVRFVFWALILGSSTWFYIQYLNPMLTQALNALQKVQGTSAQVQGQINSLPNILNQLKSTFSPKQ